MGRHTRTASAVATRCTRAVAMSSGMGRRFPHAAAAWCAVVAAALAVSGCVAAPGPSLTTGSPTASPASPAPSASATATQIGDCCALGTKQPYALVTARPTTAGSRKPAATSHRSAAAGSVTVSPKFDEQAVDADQDGLIDKLILTPTIT